MSKAFIANVLQESLGCTGKLAYRAADDLIAAIVKDMKTEGGFTLPSFGTFRVTKTRLRPHKVLGSTRQGAEPAHWRGGQGEGRQDGPLQGRSEPQKIGVRRLFFKDVSTAFGI